MEMPRRLYFRLRRILAGSLVVLRHSQNAGLDLAEQPLEFLAGDRAALHRPKLARFVLLEHRYNKRSLSTVVELLLI